MNSSIAIIGMAARLPQADSIPEFFENLCQGRDSVRELSAERMERTSVPPGPDYQLNGYIDDIDTFDHTFFGISRGEAQTMAPHHRLLLQTTYQAVENAGYDPGSLRGRRVAVFVGDTKIEYARLAATPDPTMVMGSHVSAMAGRISRFLGLRGVCATVDSACSSSLLAVHQAVENLTLGDSELALVCGVNLNLFADAKHDELDIGIRSADGKTRCFSAQADGTGSGEAVVAVLLKPLDQAILDGDVVSAVIRGTAANNVAGRSSTLTAPDGEAQAEVITRAWARAGIDPTTISYIEAHGTATRLGDPIEVEGINLAFATVTDQKQFCALSSVKSNIGHTWSASGIVGLVKAVLAVRNGVLFPNVHCAEPSPYIDFANSAVTVTRELTPWQPACGVRRAGVSSFGVMGTNVHAVLEAAPPRPARAAGTAPAGGYWIPVSAKSADSLAANIAALRRWIEDHPDLRLDDLQRTLVEGRAHHPYRYCVTATSHAELRKALADPQLTPPAGGGTTTAALVVSGQCSASTELAEALRRDHPTFDAAYRRCTAAATELAASDPAGAGLLGSSRLHQFAFQYACSELLRQLGLTFRHLVCEGAGKEVVDASAGRIDLATAIRRAAQEDAAAPEDVDRRADRLLASLQDAGHVVFIEAGPRSTVSTALHHRVEADQHTVLALPADPAGFPAFLRDLYLAGMSWTWASTAGFGRRIELPCYQFQRIRCWLTQVRTDQVPAVTTVASSLEVISDVWKQVLGLSDLDPDDSFFDLGGDSISSPYVVSRLRAILGIDLDMFAVFDYDTPRALAQHVDDLRTGTEHTLQPQQSSQPAGTV